MTIPIALLIVAAQAVSGSPAKSRATPVLQVGVFSYGPDGRQQAAGYATSLAADSFQYIAGCEIGTGNRSVPDRATDAWRLSGDVERISDDEAVVRIDWQRIRSGGVPVASPAGSVQLTLHSGDRVPLDSAVPDPAAGCGARTVAFEARFEARPDWMRGPGGGLSRSPAVTIMRSAGAGGGSARVAADGTLTGRAVHSPKGDSSPDTAKSKEFTAELFLVKTDKSAADKPDFNLQGLVLSTVRGSAEFAFSPFTIETSAGPLTVHITGAVRITSAESSPELVFTTTRVIRYASRAPTRDSTSSVTGTSTTKNAMPDPSDVLSFELPPIRVPNSSVAVPDQYELRLRLR